MLEEKALCLDFKKIHRWVFSNAIYWILSSKHILAPFRTVVLNVGWGRHWGGRMLPPPSPGGGHLAISGDVFGCHNWLEEVCYWHLASRGQRLCSITHSTQDGPHQTETPGPNVCGARVEKWGIQSECADSATVQCCEVSSLSSYSIT